MAFIENSARRPEPGLASAAFISGDVAMDVLAESGLFGPAVCMGAGTDGVFLQIEKAETTVAGNKSIVNSSQRWK
jgi:hypothetical protein